MLYSFGRRVFPVDTHCWRVAWRLGWVQGSSASSSASVKGADALQGRIPEDLRLSLHVNMVSLGRDKCHPRDPECESCVLHRMCPSARRERTSRATGD
jgi:endonuclease-3